MQAQSLSQSGSGFRHRIETGSGSGQRPALGFNALTPIRRGVLPGLQSDELIGPFSKCCLRIGHVDERFQRDVERRAAKELGVVARRLHHSERGRIAVDEGIADSPATGLEHLPFCLVLVVRDQRPILVRPRQRGSTDHVHPALRSPERAYSLHFGIKVGRPR